MFQREAFQQYFVDVLGGKLSSFKTYSSYLKRIDETIGGLDERIAADGVDSVREWAKTAASGPFETYSTQARSILNSYLGFIEEGGAAAAVQPTADSAPADEAESAGAFSVSSGKCRPR